MSDAASPLQLNSPDDAHHALFELMSDGVIIIDRDGVIVDCNEVFHRRLGYKRSELVGCTVSALDTPEFAAKVPERIEQIVRNGQATFETAHVCKDGSVLPVEINSRPFQVEGQTLFCSVVRDLTDRKRLEASVQEGFEVYQAAINTPALGFWVVDMHGHFREVNDAYLRQSGYSREEMLLMTISDVEAIEHPEETAAHIQRLVEAGHGRFRSEHRRKDGTTWPVEIVTSCSSIRGGRLFVFIEDITERVAQERHLELASRVLETIDQAVVITDADNRIVSMNPAATRITGYSLGEVQGKNPKVFASGLHDAAFYAGMWEALGAKGHWAGEIWDRRKDGAVYVKWLTIDVIYDAWGSVSQYVATSSDITERKKSEALIWKKANFDALTGLPNRHLLYERLDQGVKSAHRSKAGIAVFFIDLDRFKGVNDRLGHAKGDELLVQASQRIVGKVRESDTIARFGGDEFTVVLPDYGTLRAAERIADEIIAALTQPFELEGGWRADVSASIGIALFPEDAMDAEALLKQADQAMYAAKSAGRNQFAYLPTGQEFGSLI